MFLLKKRKNILMLPLALMLLSPQPVHAMGTLFGRAFMRGARIANLCIANGVTAFYTYAMFKGYYDEKTDKKFKELPDVPQDVQDWARKQLVARRMENAQEVQFKMGDFFGAKRTSRSQFVIFDPNTIRKLKKMFEHQNDNIEHNRRLARQVIHENSWALDHEAKHLIENHHFKWIGFYPITAIGTHFAGKHVMNVIKWAYKIGPPKGIPSLIVHSLGLVAGGCGKKFLNTSIPDWVFYRNQEREADDFASRCAESAEKLDDMEGFWRWRQEELEKKHEIKDPSRLRIRHAFEDDPKHPLPGDRADRIAEIRELRFGSKEKNK